ncbi:hypothetical protein JCM1840_003941 [Sporobolomyces johnsonii]
MHVSNLPTTLAERYLYDRIAASYIRVEDIFLTRKFDGSGYASVALRSESDVRRAVEIFNRTRGLIGARPYLDPRTGKTEPNLTSSGVSVRRMYQGPHRDSRAPPSPDTRDIVIRHLPPETTAESVVSFIEYAIGRGCVCQLSIREMRSAGVRLAFVTLDQHEDCVRAILDLDGEVCNGFAVSVTWLEDGARTRLPRASLQGNARVLPSLSDAASNGRTPLRLHPQDQPPALASSTTQPLVASNRYGAKPLAPSPPPPSNGAAAFRPTIPRRSPRPPTSTSHRRDSPPPASRSDRRRSRSTRRSPSPTTAAACAYQTQLELDLSRLSSLNLSPVDLLSIQRLWAPLSSPPVPQQAPVSTLSSDTTQGAFERQLPFTAKFGFLPQEEAKRALEGVKRGEREFPGDEAMQGRYERFLRAQAGEDRDHYIDFFAHLDDFNRANALFVEKGRHAAATLSRAANDQDPLPRVSATNGHSPSHSHARN